MRVHAASCGPHDSLPLILILFNTAFIHVAIRRVICTCTNNIAIAMQVCISCNLYAGLFNSCSLLFRSFKFVTGTQYPSHCSCIDSYIYIRCSYIVRRNVFTTGPAKLDHKDYAIKCVGGRQLHEY